MLQALNILENFDLKSMGYNSPKYINTIYQAMSLAFADRDFYYGDPYFPPAEPVAGLLSKEYAKERAKLINPDKNDPAIKPGDPYPFQNASNPFKDLLDKWKVVPPIAKPRLLPERWPQEHRFEDFPTSSFYGGTTSVQAADAEGWVVSVTPSGGWIPAVIAGRTGVGLSQRAQSFVMNPADGPYNVIEPGKRPRVTLTPTLALKDGKPYLCFFRTGRRQPGPEPFAVLPEYGRVWNERPAGVRGTEYQQLPDAKLVRCTTRSRPGRMLLANSTPQTGPRRVDKDGLYADLRRADLGPDHRDLLRSEAQDDVGRSE